MNKNNSGQSPLTPMQVDLSVFFNLSPDFFIVGDRDGKILTANPAFCERLGYSEPEVLALKLHELTSHQDIYKLASLGEMSAVDRVEAPLTTRSGDLCWAAWSFTVTAEGLIYAVGRDITLQRERRVQLEAIARSDALTSLANRRHFEQCLHHAMNNYRQDGQAFALLFVDMDNFKPINDDYGHVVGDRVLEVTASRIRCCARDSDVVARYGGDEFAIIVENSVQGVSHLAERILNAIAEPIHLDGRSIRVSASVGISYPDGQNLEINKLLAKADAAMYSAKRRGGNRADTVREPNNKYARAFRNSYRSGHSKPARRGEVELSAGLA